TKGPSTPRCSGYSRRAGFRRNGAYRRITVRRSSTLSPGPGVSSLRAKPIAGSGSRRCSDGCCNWRAGGDAMRLRMLFSRLGGFLRRGRFDEELDGEVRGHLELLAEEYKRRGMSDKEARDAARRQFGGVALLKEDLRERRGFPGVDIVMRDIRYAFRAMRRNPIFTATAIVTLALGIGANTAIFTLTNQILLRVLPVKDPAQLALFEWRGQFIGGTSRGGNSAFAYPMYKDLRDGNPGVFTGIAARYHEGVDVSDRGPAQRAAAELVSGNYFQVLGVTPALGRMLAPGDDRIKNGEPYVVLSYNFWRRRFGDDPSALNRVIDVNGHPMTIVGVAERGFTGFELMSPADLFVT